MSFARVYYKLDISLISPISIGSGLNVDTDKDVILDSTGKPFIPATSIAGVLKNYIRNKDDVLANIIFGFIPTTKEEKEKANNKDPKYIERDSAISVYDGLMTSDEKFIANRDMVALENKVARKGAKFDMEAVEPGAEFTAYLELKDSAWFSTIEEALSAMNSGIIRLGTKTTRGYGRVALTVYKKQFDNIDAWLDFDMICEDEWTEADRINPCGGSLINISLKLKSKGGVSIREYTTEPSTEEEKMPDYITMGLHTKKNDDGSSVPVIPGTSWAGMFMDRYNELTDKNSTEKLFGFVHDRKKDGDDKVQKSCIIFDESQLHGGVYKTTTRNAIDRFTGGTKSGALYTEKTYYYGETELNISFTRVPEESELKVLAFCLADLHNGFLALGGLTSIGRGLFEIVELNGKALSDEEKQIGNIYNTILKGVDINE